MKNKCEKNQRILAIAIASLLLYAGIAKQLRLLEIPLHSQSGHFSQTALVVGEFFLASLLISGMQPFFTFFTVAGD